jgi:hypothetical protein
MILDHHKFHMLSFLQFYGDNIDKFYIDKFFAISAIIFFFCVSCYKAVGGLT